MTNDPHTETRAKENAASGANINSPPPSAKEPLYGKTIVITRSPEQSEELIYLLKGRGAELLALPMVRFEDPQDTLLLDASLRALDRIDWIIFTSANAVRFTARRATALSVSFAIQRQSLKVAAVGPATARAAADEGLSVHFVAQHHSSAALASELQSQIVGKRVLLPRSDIANSDFPRALREDAAQVIDVVAYRTIAPGGSGSPQSALAPTSGRIMGQEPLPNQEAAILERIGANDLDIIAFASPSAFHNFAELIGAETLRQLSNGKRFAAIGPTTAQAIRDAGCAVAIEPQTSTAAGFVDAISDYFAGFPRTGAEKVLP